MSWLVTVEVTPQEDCYLKFYIEGQAQGSEVEAKGGQPAQFTYNVPLAGVVHFTVAAGREGAPSESAQSDPLVQPVPANFGVVPPTPPAPVLVSIVEVP